MGPATPTARTCSTAGRVRTLFRQVQRGAEPSGFVPLSCVCRLLGTVITVPVGRHREVTNATITSVGGHAARPDLPESPADRGGLGRSVRGPGIPGLVPRLAPHRSTPSAIAGGCRCDHPRRRVARRLVFRLTVVRSDCPGGAASKRRSGRAANRLESEVVTRGRLGDFDGGPYGAFDSRGNSHRRSSGACRALRRRGRFPFCARAGTTDRNRARSVHGTPRELLCPQRAGLVRLSLAGSSRLRQGRGRAGEAQATDGSFNYQVPPGVRVDRAMSVVIWCKAFSVQFGAAELRA